MATRVNLEINWVVDDNGEVVSYRKDNNAETPIARMATDASGNVTGLVGPDGDFLVVSSYAPSDSDGRPDGTIYIQTA